jgi:hypothetical protein
MKVMSLVSGFIVLLVACAGCVDVRDFEGDWVGPVIEEEAIRAGFLADVRAAPLHLSEVKLQSLNAVLTTTDGMFQQTPLQRVEKSAGDTLHGPLSEADPLRSYLHFARPATNSDAPAAYVLISLFQDDHVELRIFRENDLYGVFDLERGVE